MIELYRRQDDGSFEHDGTFEDGEWSVGADLYGDLPEDTTEDDLMDRFDGPYVVAVQDPERPAMTEDTEKSTDQPFEENWEEKEDPCWDGYEQVGMKEGEDGEPVPDCVPKDGEKSKALAELVKRRYEAQKDGE